MPSKTDADVRRSTSRVVHPQPDDVIILPIPNADRRADGLTHFRVRKISENCTGYWKTRNGVRWDVETDYSITVEGPVLTRLGNEHATQTVQIRYSNGDRGTRLDRVTDEVMDYVIGEERMRQ